MKNCSTLRHFSKAARCYDEEALIQRAVAGNLISIIQQVVMPQTVLELGCGTGFLTRELCQAFPQADIDAVDLSPAMLERAKALLDKCGRVNWHVGDGRAYRVDKSYDLVCSSSSFQWMQPLDDLFRSLSLVLAEDGKLVFSMMVEGTLAELHGIRRRISPHKIPYAVLPSTKGVASCLSRAGFKLRMCCEETVRRTYASVEDFLRTIRSLGFTGGDLSLAANLLTRTELRELSDLYAQECSVEQGGVYASFAVCYIQADRGACFAPPG